LSQHRRLRRETQPRLAFPYSPRSTRARRTLAVLVLLAASLPANRVSAGSASFEHAPGANAMLTSDGEILPIYPVRRRSRIGPYVAFQRDATSVSLLREDGVRLYTAPVGDGELFGGFDADGDGWPDFGLAKSEDSGEMFGNERMGNTWLELRAGATGALLSSSPKASDLCWSFPGTTYPSKQWSGSSVLFGESRTLALCPYYARVAKLATWEPAGLSEAEVDYPSTAAFDAHTAAKTNVYGRGKHTDNPHIANGLILTVAGETRLLFFTSTRIVQYAIDPRSASDLRVDHPFVTAGRVDLAGRDYGLVARDPGDDGVVVLLAGTSVSTLHDDEITGAMASDPWGQIERHIAVYDAPRDKLDDRFFSYAHDRGDAEKYEGRIAYPDHPFLRVPGGRSRIAYNVYSGGHWWLHVSEPGATTDSWVQRGMVLWDIRDLDGDGVDELILSPVEGPSDPNVPGYYFPKWRTELAHLSADGSRMTVTKTFEGAIPELVGTFRDSHHSTSFGALYPCLTISDHGRPKLILRKPDGTRLLVDP